MEPLFTNERGGEPKPFSEAMLARSKPVSSLTDEQLVDGPCGIRSSLDLRAEMDAKLDLLNQADDDNPTVRLTRAQRGTLREELPILARGIEVAEERERRSGGRPADCWCLGLGGRGSVGTRYRESEGGPEFMVVDPTGRPVDRAKEYCACPEGIARRHREAQRRADWLSGYNTRKRHEVIAANWQVSGLPPLEDVYAIEQYPQDTPEQRATIAAVNAWRPPEWLVLWGDLRRGKTTIAQGLGVKALSKGYQVRYFRVSNLMDYLRSGFQYKGKSPEDLMAELTDVQFLILDDLGASYMTDYALERLMMLLDQRLQDNRCTIITSNYCLGTASGPRALIDAMQRKRSSDDDSPPNPHRADMVARIEVRIRQAAATIEVRGPMLSISPKKSEPVDW